jgi:hypothetical protein
LRSVLQPTEIPIGTNVRGSESTSYWYLFYKNRMAEMRVTARELNQERVSVPVWLFTLIVGLIISLITYSFTAGSVYRDINMKMQRVDELIQQQKAMQAEMIDVRVANRGRDDQLLQLNLKLDELLRRTDSQHSR